MDLQQRRRKFEQAIKSDSLCTADTKYQRLFGVSNSAKIIEGGIQLGVANLVNARETIDCFVFACILAFPPEDEVYFAVFVKTGTRDLLQRLGEMLRRAGGEIETQESQEPSLFSEGEEEVVLAAEEQPAGDLTYSSTNNNVRVALADDGKLYLRNKEAWESLRFDRSVVGPGIEVDKISVALYPDEPSFRRSMLAREFVGYLGKLVGRNKVHEIAPWPGESSVKESMKRLPHTLAIDAIEEHIRELGGHYSDSLVRRYHAGLNFHPEKHLVVLAGLSGTGKTNLAIQYSHAIHGVRKASERDPFLFICPVRPEWTDPTGLTGYYDVLSDRYVVPPFLEAVLMANANPDSPVFVCLDEMNLARVEYYFSDILSSIETGQPLQLHSNSVPLEGSSGGEIRAEVPLPPNLYITGTINVDETTNPLSDKVLDRAIYIDMSQVELEGYLDKLGLEQGLADSVSACRELLVRLEKILAPETLGFGYRAVREAILYHRFAAESLNATTAEILDELLVQKFLIKLRGSEEQRPMLESLRGLLSSYPRATVFIDRLFSDLDAMGSFQASR